MIAIGNSGDAAHATLLERLADDASPLVRAMAVWALAQLLPAKAFAALRAAKMPEESDPSVRVEWEDSEF